MFIERHIFRRVLNVKKQDGYRTMISCVTFSRWFALVLVSPCYTFDVTVICTQPIRYYDRSQELLEGDSSFFGHSF